MEKKTAFKDLSRKAKVQYIWDYYRWHTSTGGGFLLETDVEMWRATHTLQLREEVCFTW